MARRGVGSVLLAFVVVWGVLLGYQYIQIKQTIANDSGLQKFGNALTLSLAQITAPDQAVTFIASTALWVNIRRAEIGLLPGAMQFELRSPDGQRVFATPALGVERLLGTHGRLAEQPVLGKSHRIYQSDTPQWQLRIAEPVRSDAAILSYNGRALLPYLLLALPVVLLAVWLSVMHGLRPLQQLAQHLAQRKDNQLSPVNFQVQHQELKPLVHALDSMLAQLRHKVARERAFVQDAAHEIRTPMAVITAQAHVMARSQSAPERLQAQQHLDHAIARASHLAQQLLDLAALDDAKPAQPQRLDIAQWLRQLMAQVAPAAMARQMELSLEAPDTLVHAVEVSALESIVRNLLDNALRYVPEGGTVVVTLSHAQGTLCLAVQDDGGGIAPADQARAFERFYRGTDVQANGSGLGLAIVWQAALRLGGSVRIGPGVQGRGVGFFVEMARL